MQTARTAMTAATQLAVFFATESKILRRKIIPDDDTQLAALRAPPGESLILLPLAKPYDDAACRAAICEATGLRAPSGRCCVVDDTGTVIGVCNADPAIDKFAQGQLVASDNAGLDDRYVAKMFLRRYAIVNNIAKTVAATVWLPVPSSLPGLSSEEISLLSAMTAPTVSANTYLLPSLMLRVGDTAPHRVAVPVS
jgi:hypothetical protein